MTAVRYDLYERALTGEPCWVREQDGDRSVLPVRTWLGGASASDADRSFDDRLITMCSGPTLDLGCGPGRLVAGLVRRGVVALGIDVSRTAVKLTRSRGAPALRCDVFGPLPGAGRWRNILLADGNVGIGADPVRLIRRAAELLTPDGALFIELAPPGTGWQQRTLRLESADHVGPWFPWTVVGIERADQLALAAGMMAVKVHDCAGRSVVELRSPGLAGWL